MTKREEELETRLFEMEKRLNNFQAMIMRTKAREDGLPRYIQD